MRDNPWSDAGDGIPHRIVLHAVGYHQIASKIGVSSNKVWGGYCCGIPVQVIVKRLTLVSIAEGSHVLWDCICQKKNDE